MRLLRSFLFPAVAMALASPAFAQVVPLVAARAPYVRPARLRSKCKAARPKRRPNRLHISRRVRRKHRRAA